MAVLRDEDIHFTERLKKFSLASFFLFEIGEVLLAEIIGLSVEHQHGVCVLLNVPRLPQIAEARLVIFAALDAAVKLAEDEEAGIKFLGEFGGASRDLAKLNVLVRL